MSIHNHRQADYPIAPHFLERWSQRALGTEPIPDTDLFSAFEAARWAPSGGNVQPWRFLYARRDTAPWPLFLNPINDRNRRWAHRAAALVLLLSLRVRQTAEGPRPVRSHSLDAGAAWAAFGLQARHLGWSTRAIGGFDREAARVQLGVPADYELEVMIAIGRPADKSVLPADLQDSERPNGRLPLATLVAEGAFKFS